MKAIPSTTGIDIKVKRAKEHINNLELLISGFIESKPYEVFRQEETNGETNFRVKVKAQPPQEWGAIIGDVIHNLRSSLDYLVRQLVLANGKTPSKKTGFPICDNAKKFEAYGVRKIQGVSNSAVHLVRALKPYKGGNDALWRLHELDIMDKHKLLIPVGAAYKGVILDFVRLVPKISGGRMVPKLPSSMRFDIKPADRQYPLEDGTILFRINAGAERNEMNMNPQFSFDVAFGDGQVVKGEPILPTLQQLADFIEGIINPFRPLIDV